MEVSGSAFILPTTLGRQDGELAASGGVWTKEAVFFASKLNIIPFIYRKDVLKIVNEKESSTSRDILKRRPTGLRPRASSRSGFGLNKIMIGIILTVKCYSRTYLSRPEGHGCERVR
ncbi:hypothetical protein TNCV_1675271 [Trichonephila clavipes]|nr:hypothetical protein TNCV_1675271 [Trichonephila clavipes]